MIRISLPYLFNLSSSFEVLSRLKPGIPYSDVFAEIYECQFALQGLYYNSVLAPALRSSRPFADILFGLLKNETDNTDFSRLMSHTIVFGITGAYSNFKIAFLAEIGITPSYLVSQKASYDTLSLLDNPESLFPTELKSKVPETAYDLNEVGKAVAFELGTACGFHVYRIVEAVLRRYFTETTGGRSHPKVRNIGVYINAISQTGNGDPKILASLKQMSDLHRNPLIHPDIVLSMDEAISVLGMARSVVAAMLKGIPVAPLTTLNAASVS